MLRIALAVAVTGWFPALVGAQPPKVVAVGAREIGSTDRVDPDSGSAASAPGLTVKLQVQGLDQPARYGMVIVTEARDDTAADLKSAPRSGGDDPTEFPPVIRHTGPNTVEELPAFYAQVPLELPARRARKLTSLKGEIRLAAGGGEKPSQVKIAGISALYGKTVSHPDLARAGITLQVAERSELEPLALSVMISGRVPRDASVSVIDAEGKSVTRGGSGSVGNSAAYWRTDLTRPMRDSDVLTVNVPVGQKPVTVPFDLKDIELP